MKTDEKEMQNVVLEKVDLEDVELMEETVHQALASIVHTAGSVLDATR